MTPEREQGIREQHVRCDSSACSVSPHLPHCDGCGGPWPCDTAVVLAALDETRAELDAALRGGKSLGSALAAERDAALAREKALAMALRNFLEARQQAPYLRPDDWERLTAALRQHDEATR